MLPLRGQSGLGSDDNEGVLCIPPKFQHYRLFNVISSLFLGEDLLLCKDAVDVFVTLTDWATVTWGEKLSHQMFALFPKSFG